MNDIKLNDVLNIENPQDYKAHFATNSDDTNPLYVFLYDKNRWTEWNSNFLHGKQEFSRKYIISFVRYKGDWLFAGIFETCENDKQHSKLTDIKKEFVGRIIVKVVGKTRADTYSYFDRLIDDNKLFVASILKQPVDSAINFQDYNNIHLSFKDLKNIINKKCEDWYTALSAINGVYLIYDKNAKQRYVGSAYGDKGIWQRWSCYVNTNGTGGNEGLINLLQDKDEEYKNKLEFTLLEHLPFNTNKDYVISRENYWKEVLDTKEDSKEGLNHN